MTDQESLERGVYVDSGIKFLKIRFHTTKKPSKRLKGFIILSRQKLLSEFFVFVHELINSTCSVN